MEIGQKVKIVDYSDGRFNGQEVEITRVPDPDGADPDDKYPYHAKLSHEVELKDVVIIKGKAYWLVEDAIIRDGKAYTIQNHVLHMREGEFQVIE